MSSDPRDYKYGDLNPSVTSTPARQDSLVIDRNTGLGTIARTINSVYESNNLQGLTRFKGIVLRDETDVQEQGFIDAVYKVLGDNTNLNIAAYKVRIPEVHILPVPVINLTAEILSNAEIKPCYQNFTMELEKNLFSCSLSQISIKPGVNNLSFVDIKP